MSDPSAGAFLANQTLASNDGNGPEKADLSRQISTQDRSHIQALEERLKQLERRLKYLEQSTCPSFGQLSPKTEDTQYGAESSRVTTQGDSYRSPKTEIKDRPYLSEVRRVGLVDFQNSFSIRDPVYAIEVLMLDSLWSAEIERERSFCLALESGKQNAGQSPMPAHTTDSGSTNGWPEMIRINSKHLQNVLRQIDPDVPGQTEALTFEKPFAPLIEYHRQVKKYLAELESKLSVCTDRNFDRSSKARQPLADLRCYVDLMDSTILATYQRCSSSNVDTKVLFGELWYLMRAGDLVYLPAAARSSPTSAIHQRPENLQTLWRVHPEQSQSGRRSDHLVIRCYCIDFDGITYYTIMRDFQIKHFYGERKVISLPVYPIRFANESETILTQKAEQGRRFQEFISMKHVSYHGWALEHHRGQRSLRQVYVTGDVIIDFAEAFKMHPKWQIQPTNVRTRNVEEPASEYPRREWSSCPSNRLVAKEANEPVYQNPFMSRNSNTRIPFSHATKYTQIPDQNLILLPKRMFAYSLTGLNFVIVDIGYLNCLKSPLNTFENLAIPTEHRVVIMSIFQSHFREKEMAASAGFFNTNNQLILEKAKSRVILLHGSPGVGKAATAEATACKFGKPLLVIDCDGLESNTREVEAFLDANLRLAELWDCVLLLKHADALVSRSAADREKILAAVMLRVIDDYSGILFLTTNRVGVFDEAFLSRIGLPLYYPSLTFALSMAIWKWNIERLRSTKEDIVATRGPGLKCDSHEILKYAAHLYKMQSSKWSGRQIRDAFAIASSFASFDRSVSEGDTVLGVRHFKAVAAAGRNFERYMQEIRSHPSVPDTHTVRSDDFIQRTPEEGQLPRGASIYNQYYHFRAPGAESEATSTASSDDGETSD